MSVAYNFVIDVAYVFFFFDCLGNIFETFGNFMQNVQIVKVYMCNFSL